ncbi:hypothetical protein PUMCH_002412 [Australozyma saopauloensis]|uniref:Succinate dehydrogenase [ubiquinone] cytochrome b small subunit n=1 Tax=Australozyma saopauloensis TaxID=291208 RepID=A0AAX4H9H0_9ASCO|nr:hypothetical protein PUMCH_002412 [[Candida] saopauloensis]
MLSVTRVGLRQIQPSSFARAGLFARSLTTIPQPPGGVTGNVNEAYVPPKPLKSHGSFHWTSERIVAVGLLPLVGSSFAGTSSTIIDTTLAAFMLYHVHSGFQSCIIDYIPLRVYGSFHKICMYLLTFGTGVAGYGVYEIEQKEEGGLAGVVSRIFKA